MIECPACRVSYVANTIFCAECGLYLLGSEELDTAPFETAEVRWAGDSHHSYPGETDSPDSGWLSIRLRIGGPRTSLARPILSANAGSETQSGGRGRIGGPGRSRKRSGWGSGSVGESVQARELEVPLAKPIRLGRIDPIEDIYPEVDLTDDLALEHGVSREHACIFRRGNVVEVEDLGSTNGTLLNGERLAPYLPVPLKDGDQLQLGKLLIEVSFEASHSDETPTGNPIARPLVA